MKRYFETLDQRIAHYDKCKCEKCQEMVEHLIAQAEKEEADLKNYIKEEGDKAQDYAM